MGDHWFDDTERTARKPHVCDLCQLRIDEGERYIEQNGVCDGRRLRLRVHSPCRSLYWSLAAEYGWEGDEPIDHHEFREELALRASHG